MAAADFCNDFVTSVAYGDDVVTRLGVLQFERLKLNMLMVLQRSKIPKVNTCSLILRCS